MIPDTLPADFTRFFNQFHNDTAFQLAHIIFPLEGKRAALELTDSTENERYFWTKETWRHHRPYADPSSQFDNWFHVMNEKLIEHWIQPKGTNMALFRRFAKLDDEWYLIYYQDMRPTRIPESGQ